jgi:hypothetical protein
MQAPPRCSRGRWEAVRGLVGTPFVSMCDDQEEGGDTMKTKVRTCKSDDIVVEYDVARCIHVAECFRGLP